MPYPCQRTLARQCLALICLESQICVHHYVHPIIYSYRSLQFLPLSDQLTTSSHTSQALPMSPSRTLSIFFKAIIQVPMIAITTKSSLAFLAPVLFLLQPISTQELSYTSVCRLLLRRLERYKLVKVLVDVRWLAFAAVG